MPQALIVDGDRTSVMLISDFLEHRGIRTQIATSLGQAHDCLDTPPDFCICDEDFAKGAGGLVESARAGRSNIVVLTSDPQRQAPRTGMLAGTAPNDPTYIVKPVTRTKLDRILTPLIDGAQPMPTKRRTVIVGASPEMKRLAQTIGRVGPSEVTVLIIGESGTGKELVASELHALSPRCRRPYLAVNCGAVTQTLIESELFGHEKGSFTGASRQHAGYFERAHGGTLFLDEITEMPLELQVRLLRVLETRCVSRVGSSETIPVDVRVIAATNRDPREAVRQGKLREDLLYRLQVVPLHVPPLRARAGDVRLLAEHFLGQLNAAGGVRKSFSTAALAQLESYGWPGNVRELYNTVQRAYILSEGNVITQSGVEHDAPAVGAPDDAGSISIHVGESLADVEHRLIVSTLQRCRTKDEAARMLGVSTKTLYNKLRRYQSTRDGMPLQPERPASLPGS